jgi:L-ribulokinase
VLVRSKSIVSLGSAIFAFLATGTFKSVEQAQDNICRPHREFDPDTSEQSVYHEHYGIYSKLYFASGQPGNGIGDA